MFQWIKMAVCIFLFIAISIFMGQASLVDVEGGVIYGFIIQLQIIISVYLAAGTIKKGYMAALILNVLELARFLITFIIDGNTIARQQIVIPIVTLIIINIIYYFSRCLRREVKEVIIQKEELNALYESIKLDQKELVQKNKQLIECNRTMKKEVKRLNRLAFFDVLTGIPNRKQIINHLDICIRFSEEKCTDFAVVFIDLDNFKSVNDSMGHHTGDMLLQEVASRLTALINPKDIIGRLAGDEFALIIKRHLDKEKIFKYVEYLRNAFKYYFLVNKTKIKISASFGISIYPKDGKDSAELLKCADMAMYRGKEYGKNSIQFFSKEIK